MNAEFHEFVASCSRNRFLEQAVIHQNRLRRFFSYIAVFAPERMRVSCSEHVAILDRLMAGEREHAATLLWRHLLGSSRVKPRFSRPSTTGRRLTSLRTAPRPRPSTPDVVVLEVAGELGSALVLEQSLEATPRGIADLLTPTLGHVELFGDLVEVDIGIANERLVGFLFLEFVRFGFLAHAGHRVRKTARS